MKNSALRFLILTGLFKVVLCTFFGWNIYVPIKMNWEEARKYCREHYTDLSSITSHKEEEELFTSAELKGNPDAWIGLYKDANDIWRWSGGKTASFHNWSRLHNTGYDNRCVAQYKHGWHGRNCELDTFHFYCFQSSLVLVKENKTWEEAMEQCHSQDGDLVSLTSESALTKTLQTSREAQTDHVWTGLRYLAGSWLWVDGDKMEYQAWSQGKTPQCPDRSRYCGALSVKGQHWESQDCLHKFNFVCNQNTQELPKNVTYTLPMLVNV